MKKKYIFTISILCVILTIIGFAYGYNLAGKRLNKDAKPNTPNEELQGMLDKGDILSDDLPLIKRDENYISPNTTIEYVIYYLKCGDKVTKIGRPSNDIVNMNKEGFVALINRSHSNWRVVSFSTEKVVIEIDKDQLCPNHFVIGVEDGKIAIYKINEDGDKVLEKVLENAPISMLKATDQQKLKEGIIVNSEEEISDILENFIS
ncbi:BofC C-terminal domain-containing protein [Sporosalibacterium faouarense]|uniref:BofC C-terminal domain-containing protein n=1 Tax=Sporosalibacterium faouarense TaxID=516123 RepID=UPI00141C16B9|nr:BofC C-terminal domain-containing protein [Sporosalibacterium faouarense]MTI47800.1 hypothetical protein [Bacillota bacterium]